MHKCQNKSVGNVYHLEQVVDQFFPYSQKQLGFDQPVTITFQSDDENASKMLGKTAYYDPSAHEVVLYTDNRHPKDIMRSLSHELVHHAQNCRGDFGAQHDTGPGYAQEDLHMRKMEREAYTKGNLIFRDFEDLIKTGKINIEIDFSDSGEPKMSLKEWKNNEINTKLMKKWGFLKEEKLPRGDAGHGGDEDEHYQFDKKEREDELEEGAFGGGREKKWDRIAKGLDPSSDPAPHGEEEEAAAASFKAQRGTETADQQADRRAKRRPRRDHSAMAGSWKPIVQEDSGEEEHDHAEANIHDDEKHIKDLKRDVKDDEKELEEGHGLEGLGSEMVKELSAADWAKAFPEAWEGLKNMGGEIVDLVKSAQRSGRHSDLDASGQRKNPMSPKEKAEKKAQMAQLKMGLGVDESAVDVARSRGQLHKAIPMDLDDDPLERPTHRHSNPLKVADEPEEEPPVPGKKVTDPRHLMRTTTKVPPVSVREGKISVREAKQITRRIIERIRKEGK
jgi:hypothetical protein